jgi:hypothetical protein
VQRCGGSAGVYVVPLEPEEFALSEAAVEGQNVEGFEAVFGLAGRGYELARLVGESGCISGFSGLGALTLAALRGKRASLMASLRALWRVTWM